MIPASIQKMRPVRYTQPEFRSVSRRDADEMQAMFSRLSRETIYMRFQLPYPGVPEWALESFLGANLDGECLVAVFEGEIVGHAMYAVEPDGSNEAEVALLVEDARQGRGIGKRLLHELALMARRRGVETFFCQSLRENHRVFGLVGAVFAEVEERAEDGLRVFRSPLRSLRSEGGE